MVLALTVVYMSAYSVLSARDIADSGFIELNKKHEHLDAASADIYFDINKIAFNITSKWEDARVSVPSVNECTTEKSHLKK